MARLVNILILFQIASKFIYFTIQMRNCDLLILVIMVVLRVEEEENE